MDDKDKVLEFGRVEEKPKATPFGRANQFQKQPAEPVSQNTDSENEIKNIRSMLSDEMENESIENNQQSSNIQNKSQNKERSIMQKKMGKRSFIKIAAGFVGALFAGKKAGDQLNKGSEEDVIQTQTEVEASNQASAEAENISYSKNDISEQEEDLSVGTEDEKTETVKEVLFPNFSEYTKEEQEFLNNGVEKYKHAFSKEADTEEVVHGIWERKEQIEQICNEEGLEDNSFIREALMGIIFTESRNDPGAYNNASGATGLCQVLPSTAEGYGITQEELWDEEFNMRVAVKYLKKLHKLFPDPALTIWAYHAGEGNIAFLVGSYLKKYGTENKDVNQMLDKTNVNRASLAKKYIEEGIDFKKLRGTGGVTNVVRENMVDESEEYTFKVAGSLSLVSDKGHV